MQAVTRDAEKIIENIYERKDHEVAHLRAQLAEAREDLANWPRQADDIYVKVAEELASAQAVIDAVAEVFEEYSDDREWKLWEKVRAALATHLERYPSANFPSTERNPETIDEARRGPIGGPYPLEQGGNENGTT